MIKRTKKGAAPVKKTAATKEQLQKELHDFLDLMEQGQFTAECSEARNLVKDVRKLLKREKNIEFSGGMITVFLDENIYDESYDVLLGNVEVVVKHKGKVVDSTINALEADYDDSDE